MIGSVSIGSSVIGEGGAVTGSTGSYTLNCLPSTFNRTNNSVSLKFNRLLTTSTTSFNSVFQQVSGKYVRYLNTTSHSFNLTVFSAALSYKRYLACSSGTFNTNYRSAVLTYTPAHTTYLPSQRRTLTVGHEGRTIVVPSINRTVEVE